MTLNVAVQIDNIVNFDRDSTILLMKEAQLRGYNLFHYTPNKLLLDCDVPKAIASEVKIQMGSFLLGDSQLIELDDMDIVLMRQNPPFDMRYLTSTYILEKCEKALVLNNPCGVRNFPEKLSLKSSLPTLITEDISLIENFHKRYKEVVIKPLYACGGQNVSYIKGDSKNVKVLASLTKEIYDCPILVQKFQPEILDGDKRVTMLDGKILDVFSRIPQEGDFRTNLCLQNKFTSSSLTNDEIEVCEKIGERLKEHKIVFAGVDLIGKHVIEVNVTSPTGLLEINALYDRQVEKNCWDCFESKLCRK